VFLIHGKDRIEGQTLITLQEVRGQPSNYSQRIFESEERIAVGGAGMHEARCRQCFVPYADAPDDSSRVSKLGYSRWLTGKAFYMTGCGNERV
jgi:hypothetical protein